MRKRNVLVIGGAAGIGKEITLDFVRAGNRVAVADINKKAADELIHESGMEDLLCAFEVDVTSWNSVVRMVHQVNETLGEINVLVYSAGITKKVKFQEIDWSTWKRTLAVNLHGLFYSVKAVAPLMIQQKDGSITIIGSGSAITGSGGGIHYAASKGGSFGLMRSLVTELGEHGININVVAPRVIESEMLDSLYPTKESKDLLKKVIPIGRLGKPSDISSLVTYLSKEESQYIHGQIILVDGGRTYKAAHKKTHDLSGKF